MKTLKQLKEELFVSAENIDTVETIYSLIDEAKAMIANGLDTESLQSLYDKLLRLVESHYQESDDIYKAVYDFVYEENDYFSLDKVPFGKIKVNEVFRHGGNWYKKVKANSFVEILEGKQSYVPADIEFYVNIDKNDIFGESRFKLVNEDLPVNFAGGGENIGVVNGDVPVRIKKKFAGSRVFDVDEETFEKARWGKRKYLRYDKYVDTNTDAGKEIHEFGLKNPKEPIIVKNKKSGVMMFLRRKEV